MVHLPAHKTFSLLPSNFCNQLFLWNLVLMFLKMLMSVISFMLMIIMMMIHFRRRWIPSSDSWWCVPGLGLREIISQVYVIIVIINICRHWSRTNQLKNHQIQDHADTDHCVMINICIILMIFMPELFAELCNILVKSPMVTKLHQLTTAMTSKIILFQKCTLDIYLIVDCNISKRIIFAQTIFHCVCVCRCLGWI